MDAITDTRVEQLFNITEEYINAISSINEAFNENYGLLQKKAFQATQELAKFLKKNKLSTIEDLRKVPANVKKWKALKKAKERAIMAFELLPQSYFVSVISQYDVLIGQLIKFVYSVNPDKFYESGSSISYHDLFKINDINKIKEQLVNSKIDSTLRKSHTEQISDLSKLIDDTPLSKVKFWCDFVEMTQRRNLFVHNKGMISSQYISECQKENCIVNDNIGEYLSVDDKYFSNAYFVFFCMGIMLSQVIARKLINNSINEIDSVLNNVIYEVICEKKYNIAIELSAFAVAKSTKHANRLDEVYFVLNYAQALKWNGNEEKCKEILMGYDFSAMTNDILVAKYALEDDIEKVISSMKSIGNTSRIMTEEAFVNWEIFREMRKNKDYRKTFEEIFQKPLNDDSFIEDKDISLE